MAQTGLESSGSKATGFVKCFGSVNLKPEPGDRLQPAAKV